MECNCSMNVGREKKKTRFLKNKKPISDYITSKFTPENWVYLNSGHCSEPERA